MQYSNSYTHTNLSIFNCYLNISVRSTHIQHFYMVNLVNLLIFPLLKRRKSEDLDLRPNPRKSLIFQAFSHFYFCVLVNNTTVSTCVKGNSSHIHFNILLISPKQSIKITPTEKIRRGFLFYAIYASLILSRQF